MIVEGIVKWGAVCDLELNKIVIHRLRRLAFQKQKSAKSV
jgi:hypothetical protein